MSSLRGQSRWSMVREWWDVRLEGGGEGRGPGMLP